MKKLFVILVALIGFVISVNATCINGNFKSEDAQTITLSNSCTYTMREDGTTIASGSYEIEGDINYYGGSNYIVFTVNGKTHRGQIFFPTQGKWGISFDGVYFELSRE